MASVTVAGVAVVTKVDLEELVPPVLMLLSAPP